MAYTSIWLDESDTVKARVEHDVTDIPPGAALGDVIGVLEKQAAMPASYQSPNLHDVAREIWAIKRNERHALKRAAQHRQMELARK